MILRSDPFRRDAASVLVCGTCLALLLDRPWAAAATVACALLPAWVASILFAWRHPADLSVALDPLVPDPALLGSAFRAAAAQTSASGAHATLCIMPLFDNAGNAVPQELALKATRETVCRAAGRTANGFTMPAWLPRHPLPITVHDDPVLVRFTADTDRRLSTHIATPLSRQADLLARAALCASLLTLSGPAALAAATALVSRLIHNDPAVDARRRPRAEALCEPDDRPALDPPVRPSQH